MSRGLSSLVSIAGAALLAGCGIHDPYRRLKVTESSPAIKATTPAGAPDSDEDDGPKELAVPADVTGAASTPQGALARFGQLYVNWTATDLPARARQLAAISIGQARAQALNMQSRLAVLARYQVTNAGTVVAIARGEGVERGRWVVVTNELTSGVGPYLGLPATSHVTWATVAHVHTGYVVMTWYPAS